MFAIPANHDVRFGENMIFFCFFCVFFIFVFLLFYFSLKVIHLFWRSLYHSWNPRVDVPTHSRPCSGNRMGVSIVRTRQLWI